MVKQIVAPKTVAQCRERFVACIRCARLARPIRRFGALPFATVVGAIQIFLALAFSVFIRITVGIMLACPVTILLMPRSVMPGLTILVGNVAAIFWPMLRNAPVTLLIM